MSRKRIVLVGVLAVGVIGVVLAYPRLRLAYYRIQYEKENKAALDAVLSKEVITQKALEAAQAAELKPVVPETAYLKVPFFCQAPHENAASWEIHHASCEEAAVLQAVYYDQRADSVDRDTVDAVLRRMIDWQMEHFKVHKDIHADSVKMLMKGFFGYKGEDVLILRNAQIKDIKEWVAKGYPVIAPTYGRLLHNPFFKTPGPEYHMVTVIGYTRDRLITNDVGTKRGKDFTYDLDTFKKSMDKEGGDCLVIVRERKSE